MAFCNAFLLLLPTRRFCLNIRRYPEIIFGRCVRFCSSVSLSTPLPSLLMKLFVRMAMLVGVSLSIVPALKAGDVMLDDFDYTVTLNSAYTFVTGSMAGGEVDISTGSSVYGHWSTSGGKATKAVVNEFNQGVGLTYDGVDGSDDRSFGLNIDATGGGTNDRVRIVVSELSGGPFQVLISVRDDEGNQLIEASPHITAPGVIDMVLDEISPFGADDEIDFTQLQFFHVGLSPVPNGTYTVDAIYFTGDVPPPVFDSGNDNAPLIASLTRKIKKLTKKAKRFVRSGKRSKAVRLKKKVRKLKKRRKRL